MPIAGDQPIRGIAGDDRATSDARTTVTLTSTDLRLHGAAFAASRIVEEARTSGGRLAFRVVEHPEAGYFFQVAQFGRYRVSHDGLAVECRLPARPAWFWERFVVARALPLAAVLRGREALHASAVRIEGRTIALLGDRGQGKTSIALHLILAGAAPVTDDVLVLEPNGSSVHAHAGAALISIRREEFRRLSRAERSRLGELLGHGAKVYVQAPPARDDHPLGALYLLARGVPGERTRVVSVPRPDPTTLLQTCFVGFVRTAERLTRQLDVCSALARRVPSFRVEIPAGGTAASSADAIRDHASRLPAPR